MSSRLQSRVTRMERLAGPRGPCRECGGRGKPYGHVDGEPIPDSARCPSCGKVDELMIRFVDESPLRPGEEREGNECEH